MSTSTRNTQAVSHDTPSTASTDDLHAYPAFVDLPPVEVRLRAALDAMREGRPVILMDDLDRENEADLIVAAEKITPATMAMLIRECSGIVCLCLPDETLRRLDLPPMVEQNQSRYGTAFTVTIEARQGVSTGVSAADRVTTIRAAIADDAQPSDLSRPGHVFPLRAQPGGVLTRRGHTEGSVDLAILAGLKPAAVLCELMNPDGTMTRGADIERFAKQHDLPILTIDELATYRLSHAQAA
ncbi:3,4-dihydroxy-2-butanone-4-phosphate synthase [Pandoraea oxalativorans]|uniref:3,4-dihydroxy-2-butanone-4-phosphate synthase n=1 Tax=Pandoraea oxalativorans TaxID=573737 RepID=UPI0009FD02B0|nr:3,4-dihydroxy-2-butanone-4-phosphate synthase [Pandoraea oxalativorans]